MSNIDTSAAGLSAIAHELETFPGDGVIAGAIEALRALAAEKEAMEGQEPEGYVRRHSSGELSAEYLHANCIEEVRKRSGAWVPLYATQPTAPSDAGAVPEGWREFIEQCSAFDGLMVNGNHLSRYAASLLAAAPEAPQPDTGDVRVKHDDDLRYVKRVLEAGSAMAPQDQREAIEIVKGLRETVRLYATDDAQPSARVPLSDDEALAILRDSWASWVCWDIEKNQPTTWTGSVGLDGRFTAEELRALLHFLEKPDAHGITGARGGGNG